MSMIGEYVRLTPAELDRALSDPEWACEYTHDLRDTEYETESDVVQARCHDIDKTWHALDFLLRRLHFPVDIVFGEEPVPGATDWGYGPPRHLTSEHVRVAAEALAAIPSASLVDGVGPQDLADAEIYPDVVWQRGEPLDYVTDHYELLSEFFQAAAADGHAMLLWIS